MSNFINLDKNKGLIIVRSPQNKELTIGKKDIEISYFSGGKGGQNVNRHLNGVRLIYRIPKDWQLPNKKTTTLVTKSIKQRHQEQNFNIAFEQLAHKMEAYYYIAPKREKTKTPRRTKEKRLFNKKINSLKKQSRQKGGIEL